METPSVTLAKITQPQVEGVLLREELFEKLDTFRKKPITWIVGPGGSGKTTLIGSYIKSRNLPCLWFQVDSGDSDLATFFYYLGLAGKKAAPRFRKPLPLLTPEYLYGVPEFSRNFFGELYRRLKKPSLLVFDNYQEIEPSSPIHQAINNGLSRLPEGINIVVISRSTPTPDFSRYQANEKMKTLDWENLRLSFGECKKILTAKAKKNISTSDLREIYAWVDGWAAGLILLLEGGVTSRNPECGSPEGTPEEVFDYFACEVFEKQAVDVKEFLIKSSLLPHMTTNMAEKLTDNYSAGHILAGLNRHNHFTEKRRQQYVTYQFHPLFREFLQKKAMDYYGADTLSGLKRRAAAILRDSDQQEAAAKLLSEAEDWQSLIGLILSQAQILVQQGRNHVLESWIVNLPEKYIDENPWLIFWLAVSRVPFNPGESKTLFEKAFHGFIKEDDRIGLFLAWSGVSDSIFLSFTNFYEYDRWLEVFEEIKEKYTPYPTPEIEVRMTASVLNAVVFRQTFHKDYDAYLNRAAELVNTDIDMGSKIQLYQTLCVSQIFARNFRRGKHFIKAFRSYTESAPVPPMALVLQRQSEAFFLWLAACFEDSRKVIEDNFKIGSECGIHLFDHFLLNYMISAALSEGDVEGAKPYIEKMNASIDLMNNWAKSYFYSQLAWRDVINGDWNQAKMHIYRGHETASLVGMPTTFGIHKVSRAFINHILGEFEKSDEYLREAEEYYKKINLESSTYDFYLNKAYICLDREREEEGVEALRNCFMVARKYGIVNSYHWKEPMMVHLCSRALQEGIEVDFVRDLIRKRGLRPEDPMQVGENWPWPIRIYTLGRFEVVLNDKPLRFGRKAQQKPLDLLKVLVALGGRKVSHVRIADILWPDDDGDMQVKSLNTTIYRLRKLLGNKDAIKFEDSLLSLNSRIIWVDVWIFERLLAETKTLMQGKPGLQQVMQLNEKLLSLYQDSFLPQHTDSYWTVQLREKLKSKFLRGIKCFASFYMDKGKPEEAISMYRKALEVDPLLESCYRQIMLCCLQEGKISEGVNTFNNCTKILQSNLDVEPSNETREIYNRLFKAVSSK